MKKKKSILNRFFKLFLLLLLVIFLSLISILSLLFLDYKKWEKTFENNHLSTDFVYLDDKTLNESIDGKIKIFSESKNDVESITFTNKESLILLGKSLEASLPENIKYEKGYIQTAKNNWEVYVKLKVNDRYSIPWIYLVFTKDNMETAEIYVKEMSIGNYSFKDYGLGFVIKKVNKGIVESITLINTSDFTGRIFRNIELDQETLIIKGEK